VDNRRTQPPPAWTLGHRHSLDGLRGVAVLLVLGSHFDLPFMQGGGQVGVTLFFVLSGYLITALLLGERKAGGGVNFRGFYERRIRRLAPALLILIASIVVWSITSGQFVAALPGELAALAYVGNWAYLSGVWMPGLEQTWSLAVEEQFYLVWPVVLLLLIRRGIGTVIIVAIVLVVASFAITVTSDVETALYGSLARVKDLLLGALIALMSVWRGGDLAMPQAAVIVAAGALVLVTLSPQPNALAAAVPCAVLVAWFAAHPASLSARWLTFTGTISYGLYLYHFPLQAGPFAIFDGLSTIPRAIALTVTTYGLAIASWFGVERRIRLRRDDDGRVLRAEVVPAAIVQREHEARGVVVGPFSVKRG
jgi:peptidoglycan/LPS O-acetylase OafA/YrhL